MAWKMVMVPSWVPDPSGAHPEHPIVMPPEQGGQPGFPTHPIYLPGQPAHPIVEPPLGIWGGAPIPVPTPPIYYPPQQPPTGGGGRPEHPIYQPPVISGPPGPWPTPPIY